MVVRRTIFVTKKKKSRTYYFAELISEAQHLDDTENISKQEQRYPGFPEKTLEHIYRSFFLHGCVSEFTRTGQMHQISNTKRVIFPSNSVFPRTCSIYQITIHMGTDIFVLKQLIRWSGLSYFIFPLQQKELTVLVSQEKQHTSILVSETEC